METLLADPLDQADQAVAHLQAHLAAGALALLHQLTRAEVVAEQVGHQAQHQGNQLKQEDLEVLDL
jgi:enamine deaminase RidA (YjgF/YER057c/UK114 family)